MKRVPAHVIESRAVDTIRSLINKHYSDGNALFREISGRDYGIDALIELFRDGTPTGMIALLQIKGTDSTIVPLKRSGHVSCKITSSCAHYALQNNIPIIVVFISVKKPIVFYYVRLQDALTQEHREKIGSTKTITINIPIENCSKQDIEPMFEMIKEYYYENCSL